MGVYNRTQDVRMHMKTVTKSGRRLYSGLFPQASIGLKV